MEKSSSLKLPYIAGRPMMTVQLSHRKCTRYFRLLIDSGADYTIISQRDALLLGIEYAQLKAKEIKVEAANLSFMHTKKVRLTLKIDGIELKIPVLIAKEEVECLLGRRGFFEAFDVLFQERERQVVLYKKSV